jgi:RNA polymerase sigma-70 factor (ECF subfamily)
MKNETLLVSRAALLGDKNAFGRLVEAYQSPIRRFFYHVTGGDEERSKDLAQDTFIKAWIHIVSFRAAASFSTWLYRIAYNVFYDDCRVRKETVTMGNISSYTEMLCDNVSGKDFGIDFTRMLMMLKKDERMAILLFYMEDKPVKEIAVIMACPVGTVKSHLYRGREKLVVYLKNSGYDSRR